MSDAPVQPLRLQQSEPFARQLLDSARADGPEPGARDRALLVLGLAPVGLLAVAPAAAAAPGPASVLAASSKAIPWMLGKSLAIGLLGSVVGITALDRALGGSARPAVTLPSAASTAAPTAPRPHPSAPTSVSALPMSPPSALAGRAPSVVPPIAEKAPEVSRAPVGALASAPSVTLASNGLVQLEALARVRRALSAQEPARALTLLEDFERRFPASQVAEEAAVLRIETLRALGRTSEAHALGLRFLRERPFSVYGAKVKAITQAP